MVAWWYSGMTYKEVNVAKLLVWYATHDGQTRKILEHMVRHVPGYDVEWRLLDEEPTRDLSEYERVVVAASIRYGHFPKILMRRARQRATELTQCEAAFVAVCLTARKPEKRDPLTNVYTRKWLRSSPWQPKQCGVFAGALRYSLYTWWQTLIIQLIMWMTGGSTNKHQDVEFTDWRQVEDFAKTFLGSRDNDGLR